MHIAQHKWISLKEIPQVEALIFGAWNSLPECYSEVKKLAYGVLTIFGSTYSCEQAFSCMNIIKITPVVTKVLAAVRTLERFGISDRAGAAIVSAALQDVSIISESNVLNVVDRNKIRRERTKARTTLLSQVIKDYDHDQFSLYFDGRKDRTLSMEDNRRKDIIEEHISLVKEPGSEYNGHVSVNFGRAQIIGNNMYSFFLMR
ncbi:hypothetical protein AVEN_151341-1 [Araneus ventricosus]|uniref:HAT C-terminal dimerisation domain-containing protein n=1 Tax=Araneus ventricosus TaxID=182803 RepID=A0A4Y2EAS8_ARAVE|nr:hypothetical protein AVEN_151341-1 [Araneus ventricosus]